MTNQLPHVVIVGGGFAGLAAARALRKAPVRVTLIDRPNHHFFQPLLYQVASDTKVFASYHRLIVSWARVWFYRFMASDPTCATIAAMSRNNFIIQSRRHPQS